MITYSSTSDDPDTNNRMIAVSVTDDEMLSSNTAIASISFNSTNDLPQIDLNTESTADLPVNFTENEGAVFLSRSPAITDLDSSNMRRLVVTLQQASGPEDVLSLNQTIAHTNALSVSYVYPQLSVSGLATVEVYEDLISSVQYENTAAEIANVSARLAEFVVVDEEGGASLPANIVINILPVDDNSPSFMPTDTYNFLVPENVPLRHLVGTVTIADADLPEQHPIFDIIGAVPLEGFTDFIITSSRDDPFQGETYPYGQCWKSFHSQALINVLVSR